MRNYLLVLVFALWAMLSSSGGLTAAQADTPPIITLVNYDVWTYAPDTNQWRQRTEMGTIGAFDQAPDGMQIAFSALTADFAAAVRSGAILGDTLTPTEVWVLDLPDGEPQRIDGQPGNDAHITHSAPVYGRDGRLLVWTELATAPAYPFAIRLGIYDREADAITRSSIALPAPSTGYPEPPALRIGPDNTAAILWHGIEDGRMDWFLGAFDLEGNAIGEPARLDQVPFVVDFAWLEHAPGNVAVLSDSYAPGWWVADTRTGTLGRMERPPVFGNQQTPVSPLLAMYPNHAGGAYWIAMTDTGLQPLESDAFLIDSAAISAEGTQIATGTTGGLTIWRDSTRIDIPHPDGLTPTRLTWGPRAWLGDIPGFPYRVEPVCAEEPPSLMQDARRGTVVADEGAAVHDSPGGTFIDQLSVGTAFTLIEGFTCVGDVLWWGIETEALMGWVAEWSTEAGSVRYTIAPD